AIREAANAKSMDEVLSRASEILRETVQTIARGVNDLYMIPSPYMSLFFDVEPGCDIAQGCVYNNYGLHGTGIATAADSLAAFEEMVFARGIAPERLIAAMDADFDGEPALLDALVNECPKMGNDDDRADRYATALLGAFADAVSNSRNERGGRYRAGTGAAMYYIWHARELGATADGRRAGTPLSANFSPSLNVKVNGPVSVLRSFAKPDLMRTINGGPVTLEFHDTVFQNDEAIEKAAALVRAYIGWGGHQLQLNTVNADTLRDAQAHPERYQNLIVRVWGWSGYFVELDKCYQDHIIQRAELTL
ncbi:MAG: pyruvate formate lyase family protein, partial [Christensenellales bacterium]